MSKYHTEFHGELTLDRELDKDTSDFLWRLNDGDFQGLEVPKHWRECPFYPEDSTGTSIKAESGDAYPFDLWLDLIMREILVPRGYVVKGEIEWYGDEFGDFGKIVVKDNHERFILGRIVYGEEIIEKIKEQASMMKCGDQAVKAVELGNLLNLLREHGLK